MTGISNATAEGGLHYCLLARVVTRHYHSAMWYLNSPHPSPGAIQSITRY